MIRGTFFPRLPVWQRGGGLMLFKQFLYRTNTFQKGASLSDKGCQRSDAAHCAFLAKKNGQVRRGVQSSSNFSASVAITFKRSQFVLGCTESNVSQKKQTSLSQVHWWPEQQGYLQVHRISHWLCWCDSGIWGWLTFAAAHKVVLAALSPQRRTVHIFWEDGLLRLSEKWKCCATDWPIITVRFVL